MKLTSLVRTCLVGVACVGFTLGTTARAADGNVRSKANRKDSAQQWQSSVKPKVILVMVTGSHIPQRVVVHGQQVNSASPLFVVGGGNELLRGGATSVGGILRMDPSVTFGRR